MLDTILGQNVLIGIMILLAWTKGMDVYSTLKYVPAKAESNPIARFMMKRLHIGFKVVVWLIFLLALLIIFVTGVYTVKSDSSFVKAAFLAYGIVASWAQYGAYQYNRSRRANFLVFSMSRVYLAINRWRI